MADLTDTSLHEIFEKVGSESKISEKVKILQTWDSPPIRAILRGAYDPTIKWLIPNSKPPYTPNDAEAWDLAPLRFAGGCGGWGMGDRHRGPYKGLRKMLPI